jgi:hypothetical protein
MELAILHGLLQIAFPKKSSVFYSHMSALVIVRGWDQLREKEFPDIRRLS